MRLITRRKSSSLLLPAICGMLCFSGAAARADVRKLAASSRTAESITGNIEISPSAIKMSKATFKVRVAGQNPHYATSFGTQVPATIYQVTTPQNPELINGNKVCSQNVRWFALYEPEPGQGNSADNVCLSAFEGDAKPSGDNTPGLCGYYCYSE